MKSIKDDKFKHFVGYIDRRLVYCDLNLYKPVLMWLTEPQVQHLYFSMTGLQDGNYPLPGLLWILKGNNLNMYAYKKWRGRKTKLYQAPFPNTGINVCLGSSGSRFLRVATEKTVNPQEMMDAAEYVFYNTAFSHGGEDNTKSPIENVYRAILGKPRFPETQLVPHKLTFGELLSPSSQNNRTYVLENEGVFDEDDE